MTYTIPNFSQVRVLVIGDVMLDRYWHGNTERISPEAPVPIVHVQGIEERPGGAGNVALNIRSLGGNVKLFGLCGTDPEGEILTRQLTQAGVQCHLQRLADKSTITKLRVLSLHQQLIRLDFEDDFFCVDNNHLLEQCLEELSATDVVVISDYGKGSFKEYKTLIQTARSLHIPVLVDPKGKDFSIYAGASLITPNRKEFETVVGLCKSEQDFISKGLQLIAEQQIDSLLITRGAQGMTLLRENAREINFAAKACEVYDVTGAGDTVLAVLALALGAGEDLNLATTLANCAAGVVVGKVGTSTVNLSELKKSLQNQKPLSSGVVWEKDLLAGVAAAKSQGERVVMTNGCFDILHAGHISYLEKAKSLGDKLIVAVNDDASVARLKGNFRPINSLEQRMAVLAALSCVDWVVPFTEDTPERLISAVLPHILVKGGDYQVEQIVGSKQVIANGGEVKILNFVEGCSTSTIVKKIQREVIT